MPFAAERVERRRRFLASGKSFVKTAYGEAGVDRVDGSRTSNARNPSERLSYASDARAPPFADCNETPKEGKRSGGEEKERRVPARNIVSSDEMLARHERLPDPGGVNAESGHRSSEGECNNFKGS